MNTLFQNLKTKLFQNLIANSEVGNIMKVVLYPTLVFGVVAINSEEMTPNVGNASHDTSGEDSRDNLDQTHEESIDISYFSRSKSRSTSRLDTTEDSESLMSCMIPRFSSFSLMSLLPKVASTRTESPPPESHIPRKHSVSLSDASLKVPGQDINIRFIDASGKVFWSSQANPPLQINTGMTIDEILTYMASHDELKYSKDWEITMQAVESFEWH